MALNPFQPLGNTRLVAASSSTAGTPTQVCPGGEQGLFVSNPSTVSIYLALGSSSVQAAMPTTSVPAAGLCLPSGQHRTLRVPGSNYGWLSAVTSAGSAAPGLFATPGVGQ